MSLDIIQSSVSIYIWHGAGSRKVASSIPIPSFGHVALETKLGDTLRYISFWPGNCNSNICSNKQPHYHNKEVDQIYEARPPDVPPYILKNLNVEKINNWFDKNKNDFSWVFRGSSILKRPNEFNCAGLTYRLLIVGGLNEIYPHFTTKNLKKIASVTALLAFSFFTTHYWFKYTIRPFHVLSSHLFVSNQAMLRIVNAFRDITRFVIQPDLIGARLSLINLYNSELTDYHQIKDQLSEKIKRLEIFPDMTSLTKEVDEALAGCEELQEMDLMYYSPYADSNGLLIAGIFLVSMGLSVLICRATIQTITPADVEDIVKKAIEKEKNQLSHEDNDLYNRMKKWFLPVLSVALLGYFFFKEKAIFKVSIIKLINQGAQNEY